MLDGWNHPVFEVDAGPTQRAKVAGLDKAGIDRSHVTFVELDFNRQSWLEGLEQHGFDPTVPTHMIWEGVTMYLEGEAILDTLRVVARLPAGSTLAFDYFARQLIADGERPRAPRLRSPGRQRQDVTVRLRLGFADLLAYRHSFWSSSSVALPGHNSAYGTSTNGRSVVPRKLCMSAPASCM
jgi:methyltransferase (TIGR00027 family)